jgi:putative ABC transport system permease protein
VKLILIGNKMNIKESILIALDSIRINKLRASLTLLSIAIGVFAIIIAISLVKSINYTVTVQMASLGDNSFAIYKMPKIQMGHNSWHLYHSRKAINYSQVKTFKKDMTSAISISASGTSSGNTVKYENYETNPDVSLIGTDADYFMTNNTNIVDGRQFSEDDITFNRNVAIIGNDIAVLLFPNINPIGKRITIKRQMFTIVGKLETKGAVFGRSQDNLVIIPVSQFLKYYTSEHEESLTITVKAQSKEYLTTTTDEAIGIMRGLRDVKPWETNDFELETNESIGQQFESLTGFLSIFGFASGFIALIAAGVGIMNIMLVTIKERTREIGIRIAIGARKSWILSQFIIETITLCQIGGLIGIGVGLGFASGFGALVGLTIILPYDWIFYSLLICTIIGVAFGIYPAWKAANLNPIDALRYE